MSRLGAAFGLFLALAGPAAPAASLPVTFHGFSEGTGAGLTPGAWAGLRSILAGEEYRYGVPLKLFNRIAGQQGLQPDVMWRVFGNLPSPRWRSDQGSAVPLPLGQSVFARSGATVINQNCFSCHAGIVAGTLAAGLGNMQVDAVSFKAQAKQLIGQWDKPGGKLMLRLLLRPREMRLLGGYVDYLRTLVVPSIQAVGRGDIHGPWVVWRLIARLVDPAGGMEMYPAGVTAPLESLLDRELPPVRPNPWWRLKYKKRAFWTADVSTHSYATFALNLMDPHPSNTATFPARMERTRLQLEFARGTEPPPFPWRASVDGARARRGWELFHAKRPLAGGGTLQCFGCHGRYADDGRLEYYPELDPVDAGTDPAYALILHGTLKPLYEYFGRSPFAPTGDNAVHYPERVGYVPPPLVGIWAAAPYFHNGSVPTVTEVLSSSSRPVVWRKDLDVRSYDPAKLGVSRIAVTLDEYEGMKGDAADSGNPLSPAALTAREVYDTRDFGKSASGHPFGDAMNDEERAAVVEFLKTL